MGTTYKPADKECRKLFDEVMNEDFPELVEVGVTVLLQFADNATAQPLKHHGYPAYAIVSIVKLEDRVEGMEDCRIKIDAAEWELHEEGWRRALLSHELEHVVVARDKKKNVKLDDLGRPKLRLRPHQYQIGGFWRTAEIYKAKAIEVQQFAELHRQFIQRDLFNQF